jgi:hypothetical protein
MSNAPADIIMKAHDLLGQEITLYITGDEDFGGVTVRFGKLVGVDEGFVPALRIEDYHDSSGYNVPRTLVEVHEVIDIKAYHPGA